MKETVIIQAYLFDKLSGKWTEGLTLQTAAEHSKPNNEQELGSGTNNWKNYKKL